MRPKDLQKGMLYRLQGNVRVLKDIEVHPIKGLYGKNIFLSPENSVLFLGKTEFKEEEDPDWGKKKTYVLYQFLYKNEKIYFKTGTLKWVKPFEELF